MGTINPVAELCHKSARSGRTHADGRGSECGPLSIDMREMAADFLGIFRTQDVWTDWHRRALRRADILDSMPPWHGGRRNDRERPFWGKKRVLRKRHIGSRPARRISPVPSGSAAAMITSRGSGARQFHHDLQLRVTQPSASRKCQELASWSQGRARRARWVCHDAAHPHDLTTFVDQYGLQCAAGIIVTNR